MPPPLSLVSGARSGQVQPRRSSRLNTNYSKARRQETAVMSRQRQGPDTFGTLQSNELSKVVNKFGKGWQKLLPPGYKLSRKLGEGNVGVTYSICRSHTDCLALKLQIVDIPKELSLEVKMQKMFHKLGMAPDIVKVVTYKHSRKLVGAILMERIDGTIGQLLETPLTQDALDDIVAWIVLTLNTMIKQKLIFGDLHWDNMAYIYNTDWQGKLTLQFQLIDFGWAVRHRAKPELELAQAIRTLSPDFYPTMNGANRNYLTKKLIGIYNDKFGNDIYDYDSANEVHGELTEDMRDIFNKL